MTAAVGITTSGQPPTAVVNIQGGMAVQPVVLVDQNGNYVTPGGSQTTAGSLATTTVPVNVAAATAPASGNVLTATSGTTATWQALPGRQAADMSYLAWTYDPVVMSNTSSATNGTVYLFGVKLSSPQTITNLSVFNAIVAVTPTANQNWLALVDSTGAVRGKTAAGQIDTATTVLGVLTAAMTAPYAAPAGRYWVAVLGNAATPMQLGRAVGFNTAPNLGVTAANYWYCVNGTGATVIPPSFTPASNVTTNLITGWAAVS